MIQTPEEYRRKQNRQPPLYSGNGERIRTEDPGYVMHRARVITPGQLAAEADEPETTYETGNMARHRSEYREGEEPAVSPVRRNSRMVPDEEPPARRETSVRVRDTRETTGTLYDEDAFYDRLPGKPPVTKTRKKKKHSAAWAVVAVLCFLCLASLAVLALPMLLPGEEPLFTMIPNYAFVNGKVIRYDHERYDTYLRWRRYLTADTAFYGIRVDGVEIGGMTEDEAVAAVSAVSGLAGNDFDITVAIGNMTWSVSSRDVTVQRNTREVVRYAMRLGRGNTLDIQGTSVTPFAERQKLTTALNNNPVALTTMPSYDHAKVRELTDAIVKYVNRDPVNASVATFSFAERTFTFTDDSPGVYIDGEALYRAVCERLDNGEYTATVTVIPEKILADKTKAELMNSFGLVASYTTKTTSNKNRNTNIELAAAAINGKTVMPGETFSFNAATGERTAEKGYREAAAISGGQSTDEIGGGVCQVSSTLFNAVARADLEIVSRSPHAWPSSYVDKGMDATVNWPGLDFKFRNNTDWPVFIVSWYEKQKVTVEVYGMGLGNGVQIDLESRTVREIKQPEGVNYVINTGLKVGESKTTVKGRPGYEVETYQVWYENGKEVKRDLLCKSSYKAYQETVEYNPR